MTEHDARGVALVARSPAEVEAAVELRRLRAAAESRYSETSLLIAALREHIRDLRIERDRLLREIAHWEERNRLDHSPWLWRGSKAPRG